MKNEDIELKCTCGRTIHGIINEEYNNKETLYCLCGKKYIVIEFSTECDE